jgi:hypothetical protein
LGFNAAVLMVIAIFSDIALAIGAVDQVAVVVIGKGERRR